MSDDHAAVRIVCDEHHWVSKHQPGLPIYWIDQCSQCGDFNAERMAEQIASPPPLDRVRAYVADPGNWSALDGRRAHILTLLDGTDG